jgi:hypothetical protein
MASLPVLFKLFGALAVGKPCTPTGGSFLGFPNWYAYLSGIASYAPNTDVNSATPSLVCSPSINGLSDIWLIVAAVVEILLRLAALGAIVMVVAGGVQYITSQGEPDKAAKARNTIIAALAGLVIAVIAATAVTFLAGQFKSS